MVALANKQIDRKRYPDILLDAEGLSMRATRIPARGSSYMEWPFNERSTYELYVNGEHRGYIAFPTGPNSRWRLIALGTVQSWIRSTYDIPRQKVLHDDYVGPDKHTVETLLTAVPEMFAQGQLPTQGEVDARMIAAVQEEAEKVIADRRKREEWRVERLEQARQTEVELTAKSEMATAALVRAANTFSHDEMALFQTFAKRLTDQLTEARRILVKLDEEDKTIKGVDKSD